MFDPIAAYDNSLRLIRAARVLARHDALFPFTDLPAPPLAMRVAYWLARLRMPWEPRATTLDGARPGERLAEALQDLGPSYIKLGQMLATRPDVIGEQLARDLMRLQDRLEPFSQALAEASIVQELGGAIPDHFIEFGPAIAAASIAQVHQARVVDVQGPDDAPVIKQVAVKILRPGVELAFARDLDSFIWAAQLVERTQPALHRLRLTEVVRILAESVALEMDLRYEAAAASELAENMSAEIAAGEIRVPAIDWRRTGRRLLTLEWMEGVSIGDNAALLAAGHDLKALAARVISLFLKQAMRDGFFHADMHQGNLFVARDGGVIVVDFGIMGRLDPRSRRYLAEILYGLLRRDYRRVAELHFEAGFVTRGKSVDAFAQALRSVGEPIFGLRASEISMSRLLAQLFRVTETFAMRTQPQLLLLQKTMVVVEGVARGLNPDVDFWEVSEPVIAQWIADHLSPEARLMEAAEGAAALARALPNLPNLIERAERAASRFYGDESQDAAAAPAHKSLSNIGWWVAGAAIIALVLSWV
ncbi:MAG: 2-polyprenylphenol 6-hydroxylase [Alphaproteobacteria bacterium]